MFSKILSAFGLLAVCGTLLLAGDADADKAKKKKKKNEPSLFERLDKNNDNHLSRQEFKKLDDLTKTKQNLDKLFERLDTNNDEKISRPEFGKLNDLKKKKKD